jgi:hypothetical protein
MDESLIQLNAIVKKGNCKAISPRKIMMVFGKEVPVNLVPAAAGIQEGRALFVLNGRKAFVAGKIS